MNKSLSQEFDYIITFIVDIHQFTFRSRCVLSTDGLLKDVTDLFRDNVL